MKLNDAIDSSRIQAARGYDQDGQCVVSIAHYGGQLMWLTGWGGHWAAEWVVVPSTEMHRLDALDFRPSGPPPPIDDFELAKEIYGADDDDYEPRIDGD